MNNNIPAEFYKRAAEIMTSLPDVDFMTIVAVLYAHDTWEEKKNIPATLDNEELPTGLKWENPESKTTKPTNHNRRQTNHRRRQNKYLIIDGAKMKFCNLKSLFNTFSIDDRDYARVIKYLKFERHPDDVVQYEAGVMRSILEEHGHNLKSYGAYNFDGKLVTVEAQSISTIAEPKRYAKRVKNFHAPKRRKKIVNIDGNVEEFQSAKEMFRNYGISKYYDAFAHLVESCIKEDIVAREAIFLSGVFDKEFGAKLLSYTGCNFNGEFATYDLEKGEYVHA